MASTTRKRVSRSLSGDLDSDGEFGDDGPQEDGMSSNLVPGKPGRKKNPNSQAARRDQNRIAQREFRLRKQQRIRDLEARVEILSGNKDETYVQMRDIIKELVAENHTLRNIIRGLSGFIGDGAGGVLPGMGWTLKDFEAFINRAETDTAFEAFAKRKRAMQDGVVPSPGSGSAEKRPVAPEEAAASRKRARTASANGAFEAPDFAAGVGGAFGAPFNPDAPAMGLYSSMRPPAGFPSAFFGGLGSEQQGEPSYMSSGTPPSAGLSYAATAASTNGRDAFSSSFPRGAASESQSPAGAPPLQSMSFMQVANSVTAGASQSSPVTAGLEDDSLVEEPKAQEARKLIGYHLENYRRNSNYCLPPSLRPTLVQRTVEHEGIIDGIPHPELRNRMILLRGRFNLADCIHSYLTSTTIHGDDVLAHANWEIHERWLKQYGYLVDATTLSLTNRWRKERGEADVSLADIAPSEQLPGLALP